MAFWDHFRSRRQMPEQRALAEARLKLEQKAVELQTKLVEQNLNWYTNMVDPAEPLYDDPSFWSPLIGANLPPNLDHRKIGEVLPIYLNEWQLKLVRDRTRWLLAWNEFAINAVENRVSYIVGKGFQYTAVRKATSAGQEARDEKEEPLDEEKPSADSSLAPHPAPLICQAVQAVIDAFIEANDWGDLEQECVRRCDRDGEVFLRFFPLGDGLCTVRVVEPEWIRSPAGDNPAHSFGIETDPEDIEQVQAFWVVEDPYVSFTPTRVPAEEIVHIKLNVDRNAKRGVPTLFAVRKNLDRTDKLLRNMSILAQVQATFALIRKHTGYSMPAVQAFQQGAADTTLTNPWSGNNQYMQHLQPGTIVDASANTEYQFPSANVDASAYVQILQAELRAVAARLILPEYMLTTDASNANYSSTMIAESPAVKNFERLQNHFARKFGRGCFAGPEHGGVLWRVIELAVQAGHLPPEALTEVELQVEGPSLIVRDRAQETQRYQMLNQAGILSKTTWAQLESLDYEQEQKNRQHEPKESGQEQPSGPEAKAPSRSPTSAAMFTEAKRNQPQDEECLRHITGRYVGTNIGYDPKKHNANCRLSGSKKPDMPNHQRQASAAPDSESHPPSQPETATANEAKPKSLTHAQQLHEQLPAPTQDGPWNSHVAADNVGRILDAKNIQWQHQWELILAHATGSEWRGNKRKSADAYIEMPNSSSPSGKARVFWDAKTTDPQEEKKKNNPYITIRPPTEARRILEAVEQLEFVPGQPGRGQVALAFDVTIQRKPPDAPYMYIAITGTVAGGYLRRYKVPLCAKDTPDDRELCIKSPDDLRNPATLQKFHDILAGVAANTDVDSFREYLHSMLEQRKEDGTHFTTDHQKALEILTGNRENMAMYKEKYEQEQAAHEQTKAEHEQVLKEFTKLIKQNPDLAKQLSPEIRKELGL